MAESTIVRKPRLKGEAGLNVRRAQLAGELATHQIVRQRFGHSADSRARERIAELFDLPDWAEGSVGLVDALFLYDMVQCAQPRRIIEIGVAAGVSSAILLHALSDAGTPLKEGDPPALVSFDLHEWCFFDRQQRVGGAVVEMAPELVHHFELHIGQTAHEAGDMLAGEGFDMVFIDGDHRHPAPTVDLLALLPALRPGAWVVLHDIDLPAAAARYELAHGVKVPWHDSGAQHLYECWPFEKIRGAGAGGNIGAVQLPLAQRVTVADVSGVMAFASECPIDERAAALLERGSE